MEDVHASRRFSALRNRGKHTSALSLAASHGELVSDNPLNKIEHFVVLMLENRSFDNMLGWLYSPGNPPPYHRSPPGQPEFEGLGDGKQYWNPVDNTLNAQKAPVYRITDPRAPGRSIVDHENDPRALSHPGGPHAPGRGRPGPWRRPDPEPALPGDDPDRLRGGAPPAPPPGGIEDGGHPPGAGGCSRARGSSPHPASRGSRCAPDGGGGSRVHRAALPGTGPLGGAGVDGGRSREEVDVRRMTPWAERGRLPHGRAAWAGVRPKRAAPPLHCPGAQTKPHPLAALLSPSAPAIHPQ